MRGLPKDEKMEILEGERMVIDKYLEQIRDLPVMPEVAARVVNLAEGRMDISFRELESIIKTDPGLTVKVLKIANSALYARQKEIKNLQTAISLLGFKNIKSLVLLIAASKFFPRMKTTPFYRTFWRHSTLSAFLSKSLALRCNRSDFAEEAFIAGLLHEIGQAVFASVMPQEYMKALDTEKLGALAIETIEEQIFGTDHRRLGGELLKKWNFPDLYVDSAREHASLNITSPHKPLIIIVSTACLIAEGIESPEVSANKEGLFAQLLPYTCLQPGSIASYGQQYSAELTQQRLFHEYQSMLDVS
jgi:HD-like signal output (HDOD) protein